MKADLTTQRPVTADPLKWVVKLIRKRHFRAAGEMLLQVRRGQASPKIVCTLWQHVYGGLGNYRRVVELKRALGKDGVTR